MSKPMLVSLFTDASWCQYTHAAGWGCWTKSDRTTALAGGVIEEPCLSANHAEMYALRYGLRLAARNGVLAKGDHILWRADCQHAINLFADDRFIKNALEREFVTEIREALAKWDNTLNVRWIKGHTKVHHPATWVQDQSHKYAIRNMRRERDRRFSQGTVDCVGAYTETNSKLKPAG